MILNIWKRDVANRNSVRVEGARLEPLPAPWNTGKPIAIALNEVLADDVKATSWKIFEGFFELIQDGAEQFSRAATLSGQGRMCTVV